MLAKIGFLLERGWSKVGGVLKEGLGKSEKIRLMFFFFAATSELVLRNLSKFRK